MMLHIEKREKRDIKEKVGRSLGRKNRKMGKSYGKCQSILQNVELFRGQMLMLL